MKFIFLISGKINSGKNQLAEFLDHEWKGRGYSTANDLFANDLKNNCKDDFKKVSNYLNIYTERIKSSVGALFDNTGRNPKLESYLKSIEKLVDELKIEDENWFEDKTELTRNILQLYGTEIFRNRVSDNWWVNKLRDRVLKSESQVTFITDTRFPNEVETFSQLNSDDVTIFSVRINRNINTKKGIAEHPSETSLDHWTHWDFIVENDGTLEDLRGSAKTIVDYILEEKAECYNYLTNLPV